MEGCYKFTKLENKNPELGPTYLLELDSKDAKAAYGHVAELANKSLKDAITDKWNSSYCYLNRIKFSKFNNKTFSKQERQALINNGEDSKPMNHELILYGSLYNEIVTFRKDVNCANNNYAYSSVAQYENSIKVKDLIKIEMKDLQVFKSIDHHMYYFDNAYIIFFTFYGCKTVPDTAVKEIHVWTHGGTLLKRIRVDFKYENKIVYDCYDGTEFKIIGDKVDTCKYISERLERCYSSFPLHLLLPDIVKLKKLVLCDITIESCP